jgi:heterodisulfide reductase subunit B
MTAEKAKPAGEKTADAGRPGYLYYPGCSLHSTAEEFNDSSQAVLRALGLGYEELDDWNCCGATPAHATSEFLTAALPLRNLINAEKQVEKWSGAAKTAPVEILVPCAACYNAFRLAEHLVRDGGAEGRELNGEIAEITGRSFVGSVTVRHPLELLSRKETLDRLKSMTARPLRGLKVACYYGCLLVRPSKIVSFEPSPEHPMAMDNLLAALGAEPVRWSRKTDCCGQSMAVAEGDLVAELTNRIAWAAREAGAEAIATACPLCMMNLDTRQKPAKAGEPLLPVFFFTELTAVALGVGRPETWWKRHLTGVGPALELLEATRSA